MKRCTLAAALLVAAGLAAPAASAATMGQTINLTINGTAVAATVSNPRPTGQPSDKGAWWEADATVRVTNGTPLNFLPTDFQGESNKGTIRDASVGSTLASGLIMAGQQRVGTVEFDMPAGESLRAVSWLPHDASGTPVARWG